MEIKKEYTNGEVTVVWKPGLCFHAKECVHGLPEVFKPKEKPWIQVDKAQTNAIIETVSKCPSGALTYYKNAGDTEAEKQAEESTQTKVEVLVDGPLLVHGASEIIMPDGSVEMKSRSTAFCRCGKTEKVPFCDGSHNN